MLLDMQKMDNSFTVHKALIAGASFTNPADTWMSPTLLSPGSLTLESIAHKFLRHIQDSTPWTLPSTSSSLPSLQYPKGTILIPGTFSDNVMQVLDQTRIYFTNRRASQMNERVKVVVDAHQQTLRMQRLTGPDDPSQNQPTAIVPLRTAGVRPKFKIADAGDEAIELDEQHLVHATGAMTVQSQQHDTPLHHPRWDQDRLESLAVVEWCTQQRVDDPTKIQPMLMMLLAPILACIESNVLRFQVRALQLLKQFLTMYHPTFASLDKKEEDLSQDNAQHAAIDDQTGTLSSAPFTRGTTMHTPSRTRSLRAGGDPLIWVKIFERTGLDQVFARALRPLMHPLRPQADAGTVPGAGSGDFVLEPGVSAHQAIDEELDMVQTAFQTYLVLMAVSTETGIGMEKDEDASDGQSVSQRQRYQTQSQGQKQDEPLLSVEELFVAGILGSTLTVNPSDQYRMLILDWMRILIEENIERRDLVKRGSGTSSTTALTVSTDGGEEPVFVLRGLGRRTIKHLPAVVRFTCEMLELPVPTMPWSKTDLEALAVTNNKRKLRLELLRRAAESLRVLLRVTRARIWRYRGRVLTAIATCWANSRLPGPASPVSSPSPDSPQVNSSSGHPGLDQILIESARLLYDTCRDHSPQARTGIQELRGGRPEDESVVLTAEDGLKKDIACLQQLDPAVFGPLFAWHHSGPSSFPPHSS
ncbi:hypothetical protein BGZ73_000774 [Actinomortierella ambigua]|nr:hypothetical protein BGZ73_000774 [Actinomortierella ambigua]